MRVRAPKPGAQKVALWRSENFQRKNACSPRAVQRVPSSVIEMDGGSLKAELVTHQAPRTLLRGGIGASGVGSTILTGVIHRITPIYVRGH